jgi:polyferredoxin
MDRKGRKGVNTKSEGSRSTSCSRCRVVAGSLAAKTNESDSIVLYHISFHSIVDSAVCSCMTCINGTSEKYFSPGLTSEEILERTLLNPMKEQGTSEKVKS